MTMKSAFSHSKSIITVFSDGLRNEDFDTVYPKISKIQSFVGGINTKLPLPKDAPEEIPRIIVKSADDKINCQIGPQKIQIEWVPDAFQDTNAAVGLASQILEQAIESSVISRVGNIKEYVLEVGPKQSFTSFLRPGILENLKTLEAFSFDLTLKDQISGSDGKQIQCNRFARLVSATRDIDKQKLIVVMIDFNTRPEEQLFWNIANFREFIGTSEDKLQYQDIMGEMLK
jgi:hypothetical protein